MKSRILFLVCLICPLLTLAAVEFENLGWKAAKKKATAEGKLIFLDFYTTWCGPCKMMDATVLSTNVVGDYFNSRFINLKIDADKEITMRGMFDIRSFPSYVFADSDGNVVDIAIGGRSLENFLERAKSLEDKTTHLAFLTKQYKDGNRDKDFLATYFVRLKDCNIAVDRQLKEYWKVQTDSLLLEPHNWKIIQKFVKDVEDEKFKNFTAHQDAYISRYGEEPVYRYIENTYLMTLFNASQSRVKLNRVKKQLANSGYSFSERVLNTFEANINRY